MLTPLSDVRSGQASGLAGPALVATAGAAAFALVAAVDPNQPGRYPTCPFLLVTGHWCPGCGSLRAMHALSRVDVMTAVDLNVLSVSALPVLAYVWWRWVRRRWTGAPRPAPVHPAFIYALLGVVLVFWVVRNLPFAAALAP